MENNIDILNELREISPVVANMGNKNVYQIPSGYFETLSDLIMNRINKVENAQVNIDSETSFQLINKIKTQNSFTAPEGYFESFADKMMSRIKLEEKIISVSEELAAHFPLLNSIDKKMPFDVPVNYFEELAYNIVSGTTAVDFINETSEELSPLMIGLKNKNVYQTPVGYFDTFSDTVINKINQPQEAKIISFNKKKGWLKYAAAAVVIGVIGTSSIFFFNKQHASSTNNDPVQNLAKLSDQEMVNFLENQSTPVAFSDSTSTVASLDLNNENEDKDLLKDVPDDELQQYADQDATSKNLIN